jgi:dTDP-4-dehydrorhamnose reductase
VRIAVTGTNGRVGGALVDFLRHAGHEVIALTRHEIPLDQPNALREAVQSIDVDAWVNPAAMSSPDACERDPQTSHAVNVTAPAILADVCRQLDRYLLHFSTDYVFSGEEPGKKREQDVTGPINVYGQHKRDGEMAVLASGARATILRVSWVYGARVPAFVEQCFQRLTAGEAIHAIADKWSIPTAMPDLCQWVEVLLQQQPTAMLHGCHSGEPVSWYGITTHLQQMRKLNSTAEVHATRLADATHFIAKRPVHTAMDNRALSSLLPQPIADWQEAMDRVIPRS